MTKTKKALEAEIERLQAEVAQLKTASGQAAPEINEFYHLDIGFARVAGFYEETPMAKATIPNQDLTPVPKIRLKLYPVDPEDGMTPLENRHYAEISMPVEKFQQHMKRFELDQAQRELLALRDTAKRERKIQIRGSLLNDPA